MKLLILMILLMVALAGCMTVNSYNYGDGSVCISLDKPISTSTLPVDMKARDVSVPMSAIP